jgi:hypothetical protein
MKKFLVILIIVLVGSYFGLSWLIKSSVKSVVEDVAGGKTTVENVSFSMSDKSLELDNVIVQNPPGYTTSYALHAPKVLLKVGSSAGGFTTFSEIVLQGADVNYEMNSEGNEANLLAITEQIGSNISMQGNDKVAVDDVVIRGASVRLIVPGVTDVNDVPPVNIAELRITDVNSNGELSASEVVGKVVDIISKHAVGLPTPGAEASASGMAELPPAFDAPPQGIDEVPPQLEAVDGSESNDLMPPPVIEASVPVAPLNNDIPGMIPDEVPAIEENIDVPVPPVAIDELDDKVDEIIDQAEKEVDQLELDAAPSIDDLSAQIPTSAEMTNEEEPLLDNIASPVEIPQLEN